MNTRVHTGRWFTDGSRVIATTTGQFGTSKYVLAECDSAETAEEVVREHNVTLTDKEVSK